MTALAAATASMSSDTLTTAGLAFGLGLLAVDHIRWWRTAPSGAPAAGSPAAGGRPRDPMVLLQTWGGIGFGALMVACPAGLLGTTAGILRWGSNGIGGTLMKGLTGAVATPVAEAAAPQLDEYGAIVVTTLVIVLWVLRKFYAKAIRGRFMRGVLEGVLLSVGTGLFAIVGQVVVPQVNSLGAQLVGTIVHGVHGVVPA